MLLSFNLFIISLFLLVKISYANDCSKLYMAPFLVEDDLCDEYCFDVFQVLLSNCISEQIDRQFITTFNFYRNNSFTCITNDENSACSEQFNSDDQIIFNSTQYWVKNFVYSEIEKDDDCGKDSVVVFIVNADICQKIDKYPDIDELFGKGQKKTDEEIQEKNVYFLLVLLYHLNIKELDSCNDLPEKFNFTEKSHVKAMFVSARHLNMFYNDICNIKIPTVPKSPNTDVIKEHPNALKIIVSVTVGVNVFFVLLFILFWANQIRRRWKESKIEAFVDEHTRSAKHIIFGKYKDEWEVTPNELKVQQDKILGEGMFGKVYLGHLKKKRNNELLELDVAVKFPHIGASEFARQEMIEEIGFMKSLGNHENLLVMVGYVKSIENPVICTVFCANGDLLKILQKHELHFMSKEKCGTVEICLLLPDLLRISIEVCNGLIYLSSHSYIHRDIAARNILLTENMTAKLSDFGLCKKLEIHETNIFDKKGKFPVKYMPHESLKFGEFSTKSDVWSYGILMFEMFSGGKKPFENIPVGEFIDHLENNGKPTMPELTPQPIIQLLNDKIFQKYPSRRANFTEIKEELLSFYSIVCNVMLENERNNVSRGNSIRSSVTSSVRRRV